MNSGRKFWWTTSRTRCSTTSREGRGRWARSPGWRSSPARRCEVDCATLSVGEPAVVENLKQDVEDVPVGFLDFIEKNHRVGAPAHHLAQLTALLVSDVARRRADEAGDPVFLHVFGHVDAHHRPLVIEQKLRECPAQLGLPDAGWTEKDERTDRTVSSRRPAPANRVGDHLTESSWPITRSPRRSSRWTSFYLPLHEAINWNSVQEPPLQRCRPR